MKNIDIIFLFTIAAFVGYYMCKKESFEGFAAIDDARQAVREVYNADIDAIRNLSSVASKLQAGGLTVPGDLRTRGNTFATGDMVMNGGNNWLFHTPDDNRRTMYVAPSKAYGNEDWNWGASTEFNADGSVNVKGKLLEAGNALIPRGSIIMWTGSTAPAGWALCDGGNGTPNLSGRFVLSQGNSGVRGSYHHNINTTGGEETHQLSVNEMPSHTHGFRRIAQFGTASRSGSWLDLGGWHNGGYVEDLVINPTGGNADHNNMPPFYVLAFIMKL